MFLLWTERPVPLDRERETHGFMVRERPWERLELELVYDNAPGDWTHYSDIFRATWRRARAARCGFINLESDIVPTVAAIAGLKECPEPFCLVPYPIRDFRTGELLGYSGVSEARVPGGWDAHLLREGETWCESADLGLVKFGPAITDLDIGEVPPLTGNDGMLNGQIFDWLRRRYRPMHLCHVHWPPVRNNHNSWDPGDYAHHPPGYVSPYDS